MGLLLMEIWNIEREKLVSGLKKNSFLNMLRVSWTCGHLGRVFCEVRNA